MASVAATVGGAGTPVGGGAGGGAGGLGAKASVDAAQKVTARDFKLSPEFDRWTDVGEDLLLPGADGGVVVAPGVVLFRVDGERTDKPEAVVCIGDSGGLTVPVTIPDEIGGLDSISPAADGSHGVLALSGSKVWRLEVAVDRSASPPTAAVSAFSPVLEKPDQCEHFAYTPGVDGSGGLFAVAMVKSDAGDEDDSAPIIYPVPPSTLTLKYKAPTSDVWVDIGTVPSTSDCLTISGDGSKCAWLQFLNPIPEEAERGEFFVADFASKAIRQVTSGAGRVLSCVLSPDGQWLVYQANHELLRPITTHMTLWCLSTTAPLVCSDGTPFDGADATSCTIADNGFYKPIPAVAGRQIVVDAFVGSEITSFGWVTGRVATGASSSSSGGAPPLYVNVIKGPKQATAIVDVEFGVSGAAPSMPCTVTVLSHAAMTAVACVDSPAAGPPTYAYGHEDDKVYPVVRVGNATFHLGQPSDFDDLHVTEFSWKASDGLEILGFVYHSDAMSADAPLLVNAHGGPAVAFCNHRRAAAGSTRYPFRPHLKAGYRVFMPLFRGTLGFGDEFAGANITKQGIADVDDILTGITALSRPASEGGMGLRFGDRIGVFGGSYGGYMSLRLLCVSKAFKAGIPMYGFLNNRWMTLEGGDPTYENEYFTPCPADWPVDLEAYASDTYPLQLGNVSVPALFLHGREDDICPVSQSVVSYRAMQAMSLPTGLVVYPGEYHGFKKPANRQDRDRRIVGWLQAFV